MNNFSPSHLNLIMILEAKSFKIQIYADGADIDTMKRLSLNPLVKGFTTNPSLMRKAGIINYYDFARDVVKSFPDYPVSFEVFSDDLLEIEKQANIIASWGKNIYVKIPVTNSKGLSTAGIIKNLSYQGIKCNITAIFTIGQIRKILDAIHDNAPIILSIFAGRIADTGVDPLPLFKECNELIKAYRKVDVLWASTREVFNIFQADSVGCNIITVGPDILDKLSYLGKDLDNFSLETVKMFYDDALSAEYTIDSSFN